MVTRFALWVLLGSLPAAVFGQSVLLHDVRLIDGAGSAPRPHVDVLIKDGYVASIAAARADAHLVTGTTVVNLAGKTVFPGLISDHSHLGLTDGKSAGAQNATPQNILRQLRQYQAYGVTTVTSLGLNQSSFYEVQAKVRAGEWSGADLYGADRGFGVPDGAPPAAMGLTDAQVYRPQTVDEARADVRETASRHPTFVKLWVDDFHGQMPEKMSPLIYKAVIDEAHAQGLRVAAHVYYLSDAKQLVADGIDVLAHGVRDVPVDAEFIDALKAHHVWYVPTLGLDESFYLFARQPGLLNDPFVSHAVQPALMSQLTDPAWRAGVLGNVQKLATDEGAVAMNQRNLKTLFDAGVQIGFGTDSGATPLRVAGFAEHRELTLMVAAGLTPLQALCVSTRNAAALLHLTDRGTIEPGRIADFVVVDGDPSKNMADADRIVAVWRHGTKVGDGVAADFP